MNEQVSSRDGRQVRDVMVWTALVAGLTLIGALPLALGGWTPDALPEESAVFPVVLAGIVLIAYSPALSALITLGLRGGIGNVALWLRRILTVRVGAGWYTVVLIAPLGIVLLADAIYMLIGGAAPERWLVFPDSLAFLGPLIAGSFGEELGWRAFAQPRLQSRYGALWAGVIIGLLWGTWHLWPALVDGGATLAPMIVAQTYIRMVATSIIYGWLFNRSGGSLWLVMAAHAGHNIAIELVQMPAVGTETVALIMALLYAAVAGLVVIFGMRHRESANATAI